MEPRLVERDPFTVMGVLVRTKDDDADYGAIWMDRFMPHNDRVKPLSTDGAYYGLGYQRDEDGTFEYVAGMAVKDDAEALEGLVMKKVPAGCSAVFEATVNTIGAAWGRIVREWLPSSQYEYDEPLPCIEYYPPDTSTGDSPVLIHVPVRAQGSEGRKALTDYAILEGRVSVEAVLRAKSRDVYAVYIDSRKRRRDTLSVEGLAHSAGVPVERKDTAFVDSHATGRTHGGVIAFVGERRVVKLGDLLKGPPPAFVAMLDGVEDPFNLGYALRSLHAAGADGVVLRRRNWMPVAGVVARSSAGASELIPMALTQSATDAADYFARRGLTVACTARREGTSIYESDLTGPLFVLMGGEKRGVTRSFLDKADLLLTVPYGRKFSSSLPVGCAVAVLSFEVMRQRSRARPRPGE